MSVPEGHESYKEMFSSVQELIILELQDIKKKRTKFSRRVSRLQAVIKRIQERDMDDTLYRHQLLETQNLMAQVLECHEDTMDEIQRLADGLNEAVDVLVPANLVTAYRINLPVLVQDIMND